MHSPGDPDVVARVQGVYAALLWMVNFTTLQLLNLNRVFVMLNGVAEAVEQQSRNLSSSPSTIIDNNGHSSRPNRPYLSQGVHLATSSEALLVNGRNETAPNQSGTIAYALAIYGGDDG